MDSVTQLTLGAAVGEAVAGRKAGAKAPLWGAGLGTLPDLDVLANPFLTEVQVLTFHRSITHSLVFAVAVSLLAGLGLRRLHRSTRLTWWHWAGMAAAVLFTHIGLDCLTAYGTQIFWPFSQHPVILGTVFIIDPFYTVPLATGLLLSLRWPPPARARRWANYAGLALSSAYLLLTVANKIHVQQVFTEALQPQDHSVDRLFTRPTPFNTLLWMGIAEGEDGFYVGLYSLLDDDEAIDARYVPKQHDLLGDASNHPIVERLRQFSQGYFIVRQADDESLLVHDLRFGRNDLGLTEDGTYLFTFRLTKTPDGRISGLRREEPELRLSGELLRLYLDRIRGRPASSSSSAAP